MSEPIPGVSRQAPGILQCDDTFAAHKFGSFQRMTTSAWLRISGFVGAISVIAMKVCRNPSSSRPIRLLCAIGVPYVGSLVSPKRILGDIGGMIPDPFKGASNEDKVHITWHELGVQGGSLN